MTEATAVRVEKLLRGIQVIFTTKDGPVAYKLSASTAKNLIRGLFTHVSPNWGGEREGAGRKDTED